MDLLSFGAALSRIQRLALEESFTETLNMRMAQHAGKKDWKKWIRQTKRLLKTQTGTPEQFEAMIGKMNTKKRRRKKG